MRTLFIGGTGLISSAVSPLLVERGHDLTLVTRGSSLKASVPQGARALTADVHHAAEFAAVIAADVAAHGAYDAVVQWIAFSPDEVARDAEIFAGIAGQYVLISSASAYQTPPRHYVTSERTPLDNPFWEYSRNKASAEARLREESAARGLQFTIVRPSHTYGYSDLPAAITSWTHPWTWAQRLIDGGPVLMHGDGTSLWTLTDHRDFAVGLAGLLGNPGALGEDFTVTSDDVLAWNQIHEHLAAALGVDAGRLAEQTVHIPTELLVRFDREAFEGPLQGDKANAAIFDTSKLRALVPDVATRHRFEDAIHESVAWFRADDSRRGIDAAAAAQWDDIAHRYRRGVESMFA